MDQKTSINGNGRRGLLERGRIRGVGSTFGRGAAAGLLAGAAMALAAAAGGCATSNGDSALFAVERSIQFGDLDRAVNRLDRIEAETPLSPQGRLQAELLRAEIAIAADRAEDALDHVEGSLDSDVLAGPAHELRGKALIRLGRYSEAAEDLGTAEREYEELGDTIRARDLRSLAEGLAAYERGDFASARASWGAIQSERMRGQIDLLSDSTLAGDRRR